MAKTAAVTVDENASAMIAEAAYFRSEQRGFVPGYELADWLAAEEEVAAILSAAGRGAARTAPTAPAPKRPAAKTAAAKSKAGRSTIKPNTQKKIARKKAITKKKAKVDDQ